MRRFYRRRGGDSDTAAVAEQHSSVRSEVWQRRSAGRPAWVIAHRGGGAEAPENTLQALAAAVAARADAVEIDVVELADGHLAISHDQVLADRHSAASLRIAQPQVPLLEEALDWLAHEAPGLVREREIVDCLVRHGLTGRAFVSSCHPASLRRFAELEPTLPRALGYPLDRHGVSAHGALRPAVEAALVAMRLALPLRLARLLAAADATVASLEQRVVDARVIQACHAAGAAVHVWTVDDPAAASRLASLGADAVVTDLPRLLAGTLRV
jgi:glycerophosphoryl diester phosphodiesterase